MDNLREAVRAKTEGSTVAFVTYGCVMAFMTYFCTYFWKTSFSVIDDSREVFGKEIKAVLSMAQTIGYGLSKIPAVRVVSMMNRNQRLKVIIFLMTSSMLIYGLSQALLPPVGAAAGVLLASFPASWMYGTLLTYLEGRRETEILVSAFCLSYVFAGAASRSVASWALEWMPQRWMPFFLGAGMWVIAIAFLFGLDLLPSPSKVDERARSKRKPMDAAARTKFYKRFGFGLFLLLAGNAVLAAYRNFRDYYALELLEHIEGSKPDPILFTVIDFPAGIVACITMALTSREKDNRRGFFLLLAFMIFGTLLVFFSTLMMNARIIGGIVWLVIVGIGLYICSVSFGGLLYDRLIAASKTEGTQVFLIFLGDGLGYVCTITMLFLKPPKGEMDFFITLTYAFCGVSIAGYGVAILYFYAMLKITDNAESRRLISPRTSLEEDAIPKAPVKAHALEEEALIVEPKSSG